VAFACSLSFPLSFSASAAEYALTFSGSMLSGKT
jgi:hypothetical protein